MSEPDRRALRLGALAVSVLHDIDLRPTEAGVLITGLHPVLVSWAQCQQALAGGDPQSASGRQRLATWFATRHSLASHTAAELAERVRPVALPQDHPLHPGIDWVRETVMGQVLDLGIGIVGLDPATPDTVTVVAPDLWVAAGVDPRPWWPRARAYLREMSRLAVQRRRRTGVQLAPRLPVEVLRPMGDCDVLTLLASVSYRKDLVRGCEGMTGIAVPMRTRGWTNLRAVDPAFAAAAAAATAPHERGFAGPILVTAEEVRMGQRPARDYR